MRRVELDKDVQPISEFRAKAPSLIDRVRKTKRPLVITQHGKSAAVLLDVKEYEALMERLEILTDIAEAEEDIKKGRTLTPRQAMERIKGRFHP